MAFHMREEDLGFPPRAHARLDYRHLVRASPDRVFAILADHEGWPRWFAGMTRTKVTGAQREGVGTRRRVWVSPLVLEERFIAWEPGRRLAFTMQGANLPLLAAMLEDWRLSPSGPDTQVEYTVAFDVRGLRALAPLVRRQFGAALAHGLPALAAFAARAG